MRDCHRDLEIDSRKEHISRDRIDLFRVDVPGSKVVSCRERVPTQSRVRITVGSFHYIISFPIKGIRCKGLPDNLTIAG